MLEEIPPDQLWIAGAPLRFYGVEMGTRMSVCRLSGDNLWVHSPLKLDRELRKTLDSLGQVRYVVSPNKLHHLFVDYYAAAARASLERILSWDFDRIILAHGHLIETNGKRALREAYSFLR